MQLLRSAVIAHEQESRIQPPETIDRFFTLENTISQKRCANWKIVSLPCSVTRESDIQFLNASRMILGIFIDRSDFQHKPQEKIPR